MKKYLELINKSIGAAMLISLGNYALLKLGSPIGPIIFAFGLLGVCYMGLNLFTGKCGFFIEEKMKLRDLLIILITNLVFGYLIGLMYSIVDKDLIDASLLKINTWDISLAFFLKSFLCGVIMYIAVFMYKKGTPLGIIFGIPLFIFCGFQHSIANVITLGVGRTFNYSIVICVLGNFVGSIIMWYISKSYNK